MSVRGWRKRARARAEAYDRWYEAFTEYLFTVLGPRPGGWVGGSWLHGRLFEPLLGVRCAGYAAGPPFYGGMFENIRLQRRCRRRAVVRVRHRWYCAKHLRAVPLELWEGAEDLHMRPTPSGAWSRVGGCPVHPKGLFGSSGHYIVGQQTAQRVLRMSPDELWTLIYQGRARPQLHVWHGGEHQPFAFCLGEVERVAQELDERRAREAAECLGAPQKAWWEDSVVP